MRKDVSKRKDKDKMSNTSYKPKMPDLMEAVFDTGYLLFDLIAGIVFLSAAKGNSLYVLYGILTLTLCGGDAFHLVPRVIRAVKGSSEKSNICWEEVCRFLPLR